MRCAKISLFTEGTFGRVNVLAPERGVLLLAAGGNMDVMLNRELVAAHVDQMSVELRCWHLEISEYCCETHTFVCRVLGSIVHLVVPNHALVQNKF